MADRVVAHWEFLVPDEHKPAPAALRSARDSVREFLDSLRGAHIEESSNTPPWIDLDVLRGAGIPVLDHEALDRGGNELDVRRRLVMGFLEEELRDWPSPGRYPR